MGLPKDSPHNRALSGLRDRARFNEECMGNGNCLFFESIF